MFSHNKMIKRIFNIFFIRKNERWLFAISILVFISLNAIFIYSHCHELTRANHGKIGSYSLFVDKINLTGYDPYTYMSITQYTTRYDLSRHPLITLFLYPLYLLNHWIMVTFDFNAAMFIMAFWVILASSYSSVFLSRLLQEIIGIKRKYAYWLVALFFSFASIMTSVISPDLFVFSLFFLILSAYIFGKAITRKHEVEWYKTGLLYIVTTGITLTNGAKILLGMLFSNGKKAFKMKNILLTFILPSALIFGGAMLQYYKLYLPKQRTDNNIVKQKKKEDPELIARKDSIARFMTARVNGVPKSDIMYLNLINTDVNHIEGTVEWFWGESIQMHQDYLLEDIAKGRPLTIHYRYWWNYAINGFVAILFLLGIWTGRHKKLILMLLSWFSIDILIHIILGFGLNEGNIYGCHWMFFIPIAIACLYTTKNKYLGKFLSFAIPILTLYLWGYNGFLLIGHVTGLL